MPKYSEQPQPRTIRPIASAATKHYSFDQSSPESDSPQSGYGIDQETDFYYHGGLGKKSDFNIEVAGHTAGPAGVSHLDAECHFLSHDWSANAQDLEALWGTPLDQQPYMHSGFGCANGELASYAFAADDDGFGQSTWKQQQRALRASTDSSRYMYLDYDGREVESGQFTAHEEDVHFTTW
ncbi:hypothetical protein NLG97_g520 [Lecanicillium saksenae]|uniref:Uncharacterized protein n=1 Tax=Lecanicillium saksenae TaxID=468837 RepID=A0ACC1R903_9HYPO|nr:hypothetical protein NLG97_g520 [Lecanicillium saksenae]